MRHSIITNNIVGAKINMLLRFSDSPDPMPEGMLAPGFENKVMHCEFTLGDSKVMASDGCGDGTKLSGFSLALTVATEADAQRVFAALAKDGRSDYAFGRDFLVTALWTGYRSVWYGVDGDATRCRATN